jgi:hypothetical protein
MTPKFDGTDVWPVAPELLSNVNDPESSTISFGTSSVIGTTFDSGPNQTLALRLPMSVNGTTTWLNLKLYAARVTMTLSADRTTATGGMLGGVLNTEALVTELGKVGALIDMCTSPSFANLITTVRQASDIMADGTQDPAKACDGISIGFTFQMNQVQRGNVGPATPSGPSCF